LSQPSNPAGARFHGPNLAYVLEMYEGYRADPASVDEGTRGFFERWSPPGHGAEDEGLSAAARLVEGIRSFGYAAARLDPLGSAAPLDPVLEADFHGLSEEDLEGLPAGLVVNGPLGESVPFVRDAVDDLRRIYCGADFAHMRGPKERWLGAPSSTTSRWFSG
jgi:2-oxoglutarate dehydrogenase E1 component